MVVLITGGWIFASITQILRLFLSRNKWRQIQIWYQSNNAPDVKALKEDWNLISYWFGSPKRPKTYALKYIWIDLNIITVNFSLLKACCLSQYSRIYQSFLTFTIIEWSVMLCDIIKTVYQLQIGMRRALRLLEKYYISRLFQKYKKKLQCLIHLGGFPRDVISDFRSCHFNLFVFRQKIITRNFCFRPSKYKISVSDNIPVFRSPPKCIQIFRILLRK